MQCSEEKRERELVRPSLLDFIRRPRLNLIEITMLGFQLGDRVHPDLSSASNTSHSVPRCVNQHGQALKLKAVVAILATAACGLFE